jgi:hypothetical protein
MKSIVFLIFSGTAEQSTIRQSLPARRLYLLRLSKGSFGGAQTKAQSAKIFPREGFTCFA